MVEPLITRYHGNTPPNLGSLPAMSLSEGHRMVDRTLDEWQDGTNRFDRNGEAFFVATDVGERVVGMCGLNIDPFAHDPAIGRIRHLYVLPECRRAGLASRLVAVCLAEAQGTFTRVRVRTFERDAAEFYEAVGFSPIDGDSATHAIDLVSSG